jgi:predicted RNA-binding Zn ribbon-like protein
MQTTISTHDHDASLGATEDLINTLELSEDGPTDSLATTDAALAFLAERGLGHQDDLEAQARHDGDAWLARVVAARAALREVWDAQVEQRPASTTALSTINALLDRSPRVELRAAPTGVEVSHRHPEDDPTGEALARIASPLVDAIAAGETARFRVCDNHDCRWVFEDESRAGRRRWCDMSSCGNRAKVRRYRERHKGGADTDADATSPGPIAFIDEA